VSPWSTQLGAYADAVFEATGWGSGLTAIPRDDDEDEDEWDGEEALPPGARINVWSRDDFILIDPDTLIAAGRRHYGELACARGRMDDAGPAGRAVFPGAEAGTSRGARVSAACGGSGQDQR
jgi:hypothetical protein